ncbi:type II toxin-antitoxin system HicA family toxin [Candidatus Spongiihabitans sp.]
MIYHICQTKEVVRMLEKLGFSVVRQKDSHIVM